MPPKEISPEQKYVGVKIPVELFTLVETGKINSTEFLLLLIVQSFSKNDAGCWATNAYLGRRLNLVRKRVSMVLNVLVKKGLLLSSEEQVHNRLRRVLRTCWAKPAGEVVGVHENMDPGSTNARIPPHPPYIREYLKESFARVPRAQSSLRSSPHGTNPMPLFPELTTNKRRPDTKHLDAATRMRDALVAAKVLPKVPGQKTVERWARELRQLALAVGEDEMSASVKWVCRNAKLMTQNVTPKIPKVTSPELLRKPRVWDWVTDCIKRDAANQPTKVSKHAARLAREVGQVMHWPKGTADKLAQVVSDSLKNLGRFCRRLDELDVDTIPVKVSKAKFLSDLRAGRVGMTEQTRKLPEKTLVRNYVKGARKSHRLRLQGVKDVVLSMFSGGEDAFIERWLTHFNHRVRDWKDWSGNVNWLAFKPDHQEWDKMVKDRLKEYGGVGMFSLWRQLQRRLADG